MYALEVVELPPHATDWDTGSVANIIKVRSEPRRQLESHELTEHDWVKSVVQSNEPLALLCTIHWTLYLRLQPEEDRLLKKGLENGERAVAILDLVLEKRDEAARDGK